MQHNFSKPIPALALEHFTRSTFFGSSKLWHSGLWKWKFWKLMFSRILLKAYYVVCTVLFSHVTLPKHHRYQQEVGKTMCCNLFRQSLIFSPRRWSSRKNQATMASVQNRFTIATPIRVYYLVISRFCSENPSRLMNLSNMLKSMNLDPKDQFCYSVVEIVVAANSVVQCRKWIPNLVLTLLRIASNYIRNLCSFHVVKKWIN